MDVFVLLFGLIFLFLFLLKGFWMVFQPESHFSLDRWLRGDKRAGKELDNPGRLNLQWRITGLIFIAVAIGFGRAVLVALASKIGR